MQDIAYTVGATYFSEKTGDDLSIINADDLGHAAKVIVGRGSTVILKDDSADQDAVDGRVAELKGAYDLAKTKSEKDFIMSRIASLTGGIGVIYVGGNTDLEQKELYDRVDDAVCAVRSALEEGILPGGGMALWTLGYEVCEPCSPTANEKIAANIMKYALQAPARQILSNAGKDFDEIYSAPPKVGEGYDLKNSQYGAGFAARFPDREAVTCNGQRRTFAELASRVRKVAGLLDPITEPGDRVALWSANSAEYLELFAGIPCANRAIVPHNTRWAQPELI